MGRKCLKAGGLALAVVGGLFLGQMAACMVLAGWFGSSHVAASRPTAVLLCTQRDFGTVSQGVLLQTGFPIKNIGTRRLIILEQSPAGCRRSAGQPETAVPPGEATELEVRVDTGRWCGRMREVVRYNTNDPELPSFALTLSAQVVSSPEKAERAERAGVEPAVPGLAPDDERTAPRPAPTQP